jgi:signal transduction histidine kinase/DNA-binding response OmpR family regulator
MSERLGMYFLLAVLIPLALGTVVSERLIERQINSLAASTAGERLDAVLGRLDEQARVLRSDASALAASRSLASAARAGDAPAAAAALERVPWRRLDLLWVVGPDAHLIARDEHRSLAPPPTNVTLRLPPVDRALGGEAVVSYEEIDPTLLVHAARIPGMPGPLLAQLAAVPIRDSTGGVAGALVAGTVLTGNQMLCAQLFTEVQADVIIAQRGIWVASSLSAGRGGRGNGGTMRVGTSLEPQQERALARRGRWIGPEPGQAGAGGGDLFSGWEALRNLAGDTIGAAGVRVSTARLAGLRADARGSFIMAMGAGALIALVLALLAARQITGPLRRLAQAAAEMEKGRLDVPVPVEGNDEVAQLALTLKRTAGALRESMSTLEQRVRERTRELEAAREALEQQRGELEEKTRRIQEADRLKSAFIANMSHEIRTPLNSVLALSQLLRDGTAGTLMAEQRKYLEVIERNGQNLLRLINDILDLSRIEAGHLEMDVQSVDLASDIRETVGALVPLAEAKGLEVQVKLPRELPLVRCDVDRVRQVLTNLVGNAIKFTEAGHVQVSADVRDDLVAIHVTDTGVGIPSALTGKIFQEFFQVDQTLARRQGGTGLGLAIASKLTHLMGGEIAVQSVPGSGSRFTLTLPRATGARATTPATVEAPGADAGAPLEGTVLLVEDVEADRATASALLGAAGLRVTAVAAGDEALRVLGQQHFDAVVIDLFMPGLNGFDVLGEAHQNPRLAQVPFIVLTAHDLTSSDRESLPAPVFGFVRKGEPMRHGLLAMVRRAVKTRAGAGAGPVAAPPRSASILLVEDNEDNLFTLKQILNVLSVELASASTGREAIEYCRRRRPDLIIMDVQMPGMSGLQATGAIRALPGGAAIPIIALTAQAMKGDRERILAAGCDEYLPKPIQPKALLAVVKRLLSRPHNDDVAAVGPRSSTPNGEKGQHGTHPPRR